jgi:hypothetical protein
MIEMSIAGETQDIDKKQSLMRDMFCERKSAMKDHGWSEL